MKKLILILLLVCLVLGGCDWLKSQEETAPVSPPLPTLKPGPDDPLPSQTPLDPDSFTAPVILDKADGSFLLSGPAGTVPPSYGTGSSCLDPLYTDVDRDGKAELIYWCYGPTSGITTAWICVYGMDQGWPVLEASGLFWLKDGFLSFSPEEESGEAMIRYGQQSYPLEVLDGVVRLNGSDPSHIELTGSGGFGFGSSFTLLRQKVGDKAMLNHRSCLIWKESWIVVMDSNPQGQSVEMICAAVTDNGVTVTGFFSYQQPGADGEVLCTQDGAELIAPVEDLKALEGLRIEQLTERLGPCHFDLGSGTDTPCWFTQDGKLLILQMNAVSEHAALHDLMTGEPLLIAQKEKWVSVDLSSVPSRVDGAEAWSAFLQTTSAGEPDEILLQLDYGDGIYVVALSYDGAVYMRTEDGVSNCYRYLITDVEEDPPPTALYVRAVHYLLSDDPNMTFQRWIGRMLSSTIDPDSPSTAILFSLREAAKR